MLKRKKHRFVRLGAAGAFALAIAAFGLEAPGGSASTATTAASGVAQATALVKQAQSPQHWRAPGPAFNARKAAGGKLIEEVMLSEAIPFDVNMHIGLTQALKAVGASEFLFNPNSNPALYPVAIKQGIQRHAKLIFIRSILPSVVAPELKQAAAAGIKVGGGMWVDSGVEPGSPAWPKSFPSSVLFNANHCFVCAGRAMADFTIADSKGHANAIIIYPPDVPYIAAATVQGLKSEFAKLCSACKIQTAPEPVAQWPNLYTLVQSLIRRNPSVNYIIPVFDAMALYAVPGIHAAGAQNRVKVVTFNASPAVMQLVKKHDVVAADVGSAAYWEGWGQADSIFRALGGLKIPSNIYVPERTFDWSNIGSVNLNAQESTWYDGTNDYVKDYEKLWGVAK